MKGSVRVVGDSRTQRKSECGDGVSSRKLTKYDRLMQAMTLSWVWRRPGCGTVDGARLGGAMYWGTL